MRKDIEKYKKLSDELVCVPSGFVREDGTEIMAWTLKSLVEGIQKENFDDLKKEYEKEIQGLYSTKEQFEFIVKEDEEKYTYPSQEYETEAKDKQQGNNLPSGSTTNSKHDKLFKIILSNKQEAVGFIKKVLNSKKDINIENIELYNKEYITEKFEKRETDLTYKIAEKNLYIIIEHQSTIDRTMPYRIQRYKMLLMNEIINKKEMKKVGNEFPRVIAIVLYTGIGKWSVEKLEDVQRPLEWYKEIDKEFELVDINKYTDEELMKDELVITKAMLIEKQKDARKVRDILNKVNQIVKDKPEKIKLLLEILKYILLNSKSEEIRKEADKIIKEHKGGEETVLNMVTVYNKALDEQREAGIKEGKIAGIKEGKKEGQKTGDRQRQIKTAKRLLKEKMKPEFISKITDLSIEEIEKLK